ncbi:MAG: DUF2244 domain-containing protein [Betaproteobacteria bacterium]
MPGADLPPLPAEPEFSVIARWNLSLPARDRWRIFGALATFSLLLASAFAAVGAWPVLPYSVVELSVLALAFRYVERRATSFERLTVCGDRVIVERSANGALTRREWNRLWLRVETSDARLGRAGRLFLCFGAERWEFGDALPREAREAVARDLKRLTGARSAA